MPRQKQKVCHNGHRMTEKNLIFRTKTVKGKTIETRECRKCAMAGLYKRRQAAKERKEKLARKKAKSNSRIAA